MQITPPTGAVQCASLDAASHLGVKGGMGHRGANDALLEFHTVGSVLGNFSHSMDHVVPLRLLIADVFSFICRTI